MTSTKSTITTAFMPESYHHATPPRARESGGSIEHEKPNARRF